MPQKFWTIKNKIDGETANAEILIYGEITSEKYWPNDVTAVDFANDLKGLNDADVTVRINSPGGDVFQAHAIYNLLKSYKGKVTCCIDGLAASAATIVAAAADKVVMPKNALFMIHNPATFCVDLLTAEDMEKMKDALEAVKNSILEAYMSKCKLSKDELSSMMDAETWMNAEEAKEHGFCDEIEGDANLVVDGKFLIVNHAKYSTEKFINFRQELVEKEKKMSVIDKLNEIISELKGGKSNLETDNTPAAPVVDEAAIVARERERIAALDAVEITNDAVKAIISQAKANGSTLADVQEYIDAVKDINIDAQRLFVDEVIDNQESGVEKVGAGIQPGKVEDNNILDEKAFGEMFK